ncbi:Methionine import ATP-binding protein MetN, partial [Haemophilus influenzae]
MIKLNN